MAGVLFGLVHATTFPLDTLPPRMAFGVIASLLYEYSASLYPGIALHSLVDATASETSITGHNRIVFPAYIVLGGILLLYAVIPRRRVGARDRRARHSSQRPR